MALRDLLSRWIWRKRMPTSPSGTAPSLLQLSAPTTEAGGTEDDFEHPIRANVGRTRFDLQNMSSLELITATVDIRGLLRPGVSAAEARAALRQAWASDPIIRRFIDIADSPWDSEPKASPRFRALRAADPDQTPLANGLNGALDQVNKVTQTIRELLPVSRDAVGPADQPNAATMEQEAAPDEKDTPSSHRPHGGALPR